MDKQLKQNSWVRGSAIGRGSFGTVSLAAKSSGGGCVFAVKSVDRSSCLPSQIEALENEIRILRSVSSPYVVAYLGDDETAPCYRNLHMEYLPGGTAADAALERRRGGGDGVEDERSVGNHAFCVASALKYLHAQGIVHCDVKGDNVLVGPAPAVAKLADFGSAAVVTSTSAANRITPRGSPMWMAPEVIRGEYQGPESDVWSLGCTVIEMVTGKPPWEDRGAAETICRIGYSDELPPIPAELSDTGRDFVEKCLRREIDQRWSCDQLLQHPFISKCSPPAAAFSARLSPRCVLDSFNVEYSDDEEEHNSPSTSTAYSKLGGSIGKLSLGGGAIWESDGWTTVRDLSSNAESAAVSVSVSGEGIRWEFSESTGTELENEDSIGIDELSNEEYLVDSSPTAVEESVRNDHHRRDQNGVVRDSDEPQQSRLWSLLSLFILYWFHGLYTETNSKCYQLTYYYYSTPMKSSDNFIFIEI